MAPKTRQAYQYEAPVTPSKWMGEEQRFSLRVKAALEDLYQKFGRLSNRTGEGTVSSVNGIVPDADGNVSWLPSLSDLASAQRGRWDGNTMPADVPNGISYVDGGGSDASSTGFPCNYATAVCFKLSQDRCFQIVAEKGGTGKTYTRTPQGNSSQGWNEWARLYSSTNNPTASDVGALASSYKDGIDSLIKRWNVKTNANVCANIDNPAQTGFFHCDKDTAGTKPTTHGELLHITEVPNWSEHQLFFSTSGDQIWHRYRNNNGTPNSAAWSAWKRIMAVQDVYPVGSIYLSVNSTSPASLFGGTWEQLKDRFLLGAGSSYTNGSTGGSATHTLTVNEMPKHKHREVFDVGNNFIRPIAASASSAYTESTSVTDGTYKRITESFENASASSTTPFYPILTMEAGGGAAHNNMPPYLVVYMWKRVS